MAQIYPTTMEAAMPKAGDIAKARKQLEAAGVKYVMSCWIDLLGIPKTKPVPVAEFEELCHGKGPQFAVHSVSMVPELGPADPDQVPIPDLNSLQVCPWHNEVAIVFADLFMNNAPYAVCPRLALKRQVKAAADAGYAFYAGIEPEFIVLRYNDEGEVVKAIDDDPDPGHGFRPQRQAFGYDVEFSCDAMPYVGALIDYLGELGWGLKDTVAEGAYSQIELDFTYTDMLQMADRLTFLRIMLKEVAKQHGLFVTFMPKPTQGDWRSGAHINHSIQSIDKPGANLFKAEDGSWSDITYNVLGGMLQHGAALTAITCSTVNSYKGLIARASGFEGGTVTWAPTHITYGSNNRSAMLRLPQARHAIENRASDMCMNAYLGLAMTTAASLKGIKERIDAGPPTDTSLYDTSDDELKRAGRQHLPSTLLEAVRAFDEDELAKEVLGPVMHNSYSQYKHAEWNRFHEHVTEWERIEYLRFY
ncbi:MAG: glutamine synthetase family protein [Gammaproteobacteria bacterium]|nr:glutamine synthetase family protein [Gammaproteobacteria bacterium]